MNRKMILCIIKHVFAECKENNRIIERWIPPCTAWTVQCMLERYEEDSTVVTLLDVCRECAVYRMECYSTEPSMGFVEEMVYNYGDDNIEFASHDFIACPQNMYFPDDQEIVEYIATTDKNKQEEKDNG